MNDILSALKGKKTYLISCLIGASAFAWGMGWITKEQNEIFTTALLGAGLAALRGGLGK